VQDPGRAQELRGEVVAHVVDLEIDDAGSLKYRCHGAVEATAGNRQRLAA